MSRGRSRSWRPERKAEGKQSRRRTIMLLIAVLVGLVGLLIIPTMFANPSFRTALMLPQFKAIPTAPFSVLRSASVASGAERLERLFRDLHERNPGQVGEVTSVKLLADISSAAKPNEKLLLYCGLEPLIADNDGPEVQLWDGAETRIAFPKLLTELSKLQASQIILVMDFLQRDTGIANGRLSDDAIPLMKASVDAAKMKKLVVIFPCKSNQRNRESLGSASVSAENITGLDAATATASGDQSSGLGTVLTASLFSAFEEGKYTSLNELFKSVRDGVSGRVQSQYRQTQTVQLYPDNSPLRDSDLLVRAEELPSLTDDSDVLSDESATDTDTSVKNSVAQNTETDNAVPPVATHQTQLGTLAKTRSELAKSGEAIATNPVEWTQLSLAVSSARLDLIYGHDNSAHFDMTLRAANQLVDKITFDLSQVKATKSKVSFAPWFTQSSSGNLTPPGDRLKLFGDAFANLKQEQPTEDLSFEFQSSETRIQFAGWIVQEIGELRKTIDTQGDSQKQQRKLLEWRRFITHLPDRGWAQSDWPEPLFTIDEILRQPISQQPAERVRALQELLRLRQHTLEYATGTLEGNGRFRQSVWLDVSKELKSLLIGLTAAERWLALGPEGLQKSQQKLKVAQSNWSDLHRKLKSRHAISVLPDLQQSEIPFLIQFLAQQQEEVDITEEELNVALVVADNILAGLEVGPDQFSPGTHGGTGLSTTEIQAMFQLTRNLATAPADEQDLAHLTVLHDYVTDRIATGPGGIEAQRLVSFVTSERSIADCLADLRRNSASETDSNQGRTGLRLSSWSIRLLDSISGTIHGDLWRLWKSLVKAIQSDEAESVWKARTELAVGIADAWATFRSQPSNTSAADLFVTQQMASRLLADDLAQRINARTPNVKLYQQVYDDRLTGVPPMAVVTDQPEWADTETQVGAANTAVVKLRTRADRIYIQDRAFEPKLKLSRQLGWYRLDGPSKISELEFSAANSAAETRVLKLVLANENDVVFASQDLTVYPNAEAEWEFSVVKAGEPIILTDGRDLTLPPSTRSPKGKDTPISLNFQLKKVNGASLQANVELFAIQIDGTEQSMGTREVDFSASDTVLIPFAPEASTEGTAAPKVSPLAPGKEVGIDVQGGIRLEVTSDIRGATTTSIMIRPLIADATEYVETPQVVYDSKLRQLTIVVTMIQDVATLAPSSLPLEIHFNPLLFGMLQQENSGPTKKPELQEGPNTFEFIFFDKLRSRLSGIDDFEFSMSVGGIPHAWRWRLEEDGVTLIAPDEPVVRMDLSVQNPDEEVRQFRSRGNLLLGADWKQAKLDIQMHLHGGQFGSRKFEAEHELRLNLERQDTNQPLGTVFGAVDIFTSRPESIRVSAGKKGAWNFSTHTSSYEKPGLQINEEISLGAGKYELVAELRTLATNRLAQHRQAFTFDDTPPRFDESDIEISSELRTGGPVKGHVTVVDPESEITEIQVGFGEFEFKKFDSSGQFNLPAGWPGIPKPNPTAQFPSETVTLIVTAVNQAGLETTVKKNLSFERRAMTSSASKTKATGSVEFKYDSPRAWTATLKNSSGLRLPPKTGRSPILFDDVPVGTYTIFWKTGVGAKSGTTSSFLVKSGEPAVVEP